MGSSWALHYEEGPCSVPPAQWHLPLGVEHAPPEDRVDAHAHGEGGGGGGEAEGDQLDEANLAVDQASEGQRAQQQNQLRAAYDGGDSEQSDRRADGAVDPTADRPRDE